MTGVTGNPFESSTGESQVPTFPLPESQLHDERGSLINPLHVKHVAANQTLGELEKQIRDDYPMEGVWSARLSGRRLLAPSCYINALALGGVITAGASKNILIFGNLHWERFQQLLAREYSIGVSQIETTVARHMFSHMQRFDALDADGGIELNKNLADFINVDDGDVVIVGMVYFAEVYSSKNYEAQKLTPADIATIAQGIR